MQDKFDPVKRFNERASIYDRDIVRIIPGYEALHSNTLHLLETALGEDAFLLVAGVGTGNETVAAVLRNRRWRVTGFDVAENMIKTAEAKIEKHGLGSRVELIHGALDEVLQESFDAATALLVMHFIPYADKHEFLKGINLRLKPGGLFVTADFTCDRESYEYGTFERAWEEYMLATTEKKEVDERIWHTRHDLDILSHQETLDHLRRAGFTNTRLFWKSLIFSAYVSEKEDV
ncbi:MAG TPA: class I SAM-dependent methyltransferase [Thermodesulfobacteriota bacterium]|nr:class I SAM-dependent methyltransferase [Thermodesulfobacteriota bacterium]